ncbi:MAG: AIR synthase family protein [Thermoproteota archaeon]|nr:AIR synthase family protein [Thermoproteota archaeon]
MVGKRLKLPLGKVPIEILKEIIYRRSGAKRKEVILGPAVGEDGALVQVGDKVLVSCMDPITGALERIGWLAVNINANDVATFGVSPTFFSSSLLLPENATNQTVQTICDQIDRAARKLEIAVVGGHSEVTPGLTNPIVVGGCMGITEKGRYVTSGGAESGDKLILTKGAGIEGTAILAADRHTLLEKRFNTGFLEGAKGFFKHISVVKEATLAFKAGGVTAMHDPTEGGVAGGVHEMADASNVGVQVFEEKIPVSPETRKICEFFEIDSMQLISSGALLISVKPNFAGKVIKVLKRRNIEASIIGEILDAPNSRVLVRKDGTKTELARPVSDHLWVALGKGNGGKV